MFQTSMTALQLAGLILTLWCGGCTSGAPITPGPPPPPPPPPPAPGPADVRLQEVATGLDFPVLVTTPPGDMDRLFVVEKSGKIRIIRNGSVVSTPFLDVGALISDGGERGLLGLAFHPGYASNGRFAIHYTNTAGDTRVVTYRVSTNPDLADPSSAQVILAVDQPFSNHNGGMIEFGPDGKLYIGLGDGGSGGDPFGNGQDRNTLLGKLLRLDVNANGQASIPSDNPFVGQGGRRGEIWSYGLRNPWRFSFDRETGDLYVADVGQNSREEVDVAPQSSERGKGWNYGWDIMEGNACFEGPGCNGLDLAHPALDYSHNDGCSVTGGYVYRGSALPLLQGHYFYADWCQGWVRSFRWTGTAVTDLRDWATLRPGGQIPSFGQDARGELYVMTSSGRVYRIVAATPP